MYVENHSGKVRLGLGVAFIKKYVASSVSDEDLCSFESLASFSYESPCMHSQ